MDQATSKVNKRGMSEASRANLRRGGGRAPQAVEPPVAAVDSGDSAPALPEIIPETARDLPIDPDSIVSSVGQLVSTHYHAASEVVGRILSGKLRVPGAVRASTALRVLEFGMERDKGGAPGGDSLMAAMVGKLAESLGMRAPRAPVVIESGAEPVDAARSAQSQQQPDS